MTSMETIIQFIRYNAQYGGVAIKSRGYSAARLPKEWIEARDDKEIEAYMHEEIRTFDRHVAAVRAGGAVAVFIIGVSTYEVLHTQVYDTDGYKFKWTIVR